MLADRPVLNARALKVHDAVFVSEVHPGDELTLFAQLLDHDALAATMIGQTLRGREVCAVATIEAYFVS